MDTDTIDTTAVILVPLDRLQAAADNLRGPGGDDVGELARSIAGIEIVEPLLVTRSTANRAAT